MTWYTDQQTSLYSYVEGHRTISIEAYLTIKILNTSAGKGLENGRQKCNGEFYIVDVVIHITFLRISDAVALALSFDCPNYADLYLYRPSSITWA